jgi:hypothetical protein
MYKKLYREDYESLNDQGVQFDFEIHEAITPIIERWIKDGYSTLDLESVMMSTIDCLMAAERVTRAISLKRKRRLEEQNNQGSL